MKFVKRTIIVILSLIAVFWMLSLNAGPRAEKFDYGVTFSYPYAESLGLDWKQVYQEALSDLKVKRWRIPAFWNQIEPRQGTYNFESLDYQVREAEKNNAKIILAVGRRLPRWPECHDPDWLKTLSLSQQQNALLSMIETVVLRYYNSPAVEVWQVENEPFLSSFGECPKPDTELLDKEIALVKKLDPARPVLISDSGELSSWLPAGRRGEIFGTTLYRYVFSDVFKRYWVNYIPFWFYRVKAGYLRLLNPGKPIVIIELQAEPWTTRGILKTPIEEQFRTMSMGHFERLLSVAEATGFNPQYLWGVEWWYWMKTQNHPEFWEKVKSLTAQ